MEGGVKKQTRLNTRRKLCKSKTLSIYTRNVTLHRLCLLADAPRKTALKVTSWNCKKTKLYPLQSKIQSLYPVQSQLKKHTTHNIRSRSPRRSRLTRHLLASTKQKVPLKRPQSRRNEQQRLLSHGICFLNVQSGL